MSMTSWQWPSSTIAQVIDGDTVHAVVSRDIGFGGRTTFPVRLRLARINAAKLATTRGKRAREHLVQLLGQAPVLIQTLKPYKFGGPDDSPGEWMAEITLPDGRNVSDVMVADGFAVPWGGDGARPEDD